MKRKEQQHEWQRAPFTGTVTCRKCDLLPLDEEDAQSVCEGKKEQSA